jgi:hypothetical protein
MQKGHSSAFQAPVTIDNQLQFTANLCTAHILQTSLGTTGVQLPWNIKLLLFLLYPKHYYARA